MFGLGRHWQERWQFCPMGSTRLYPPGRPPRRPTREWTRGHGATSINVGLDRQGRVDNTEAGVDGTGPGVPGVLRHHVGGPGGAEAGG
eukprot:594510-Pyramimonas_sp.AAC.2